jgi:hypothetical protein
MNLQDRLESISSRQDLRGFVDALKADLTENPDAWENDSLERFLGALAGWIGDMDGYFKNQGLKEPAEPDWQLVGRMLFAASIYE